MGNDIAGDGSGHRVKATTGRLYVRKAEYHQRQHLPPAGNDHFEADRAVAWRKVAELMQLPFQRRRLAGEERFPIADIYALMGGK